MVGRQLVATALALTLAACSDERRHTEPASCAGDATGDSAVEWPACVVDDDCDDDLFCTTDRCIAGACEWTVAPYYCAIDGVCVPDLMGGYESPADNPCVECQPATDPWHWSPAYEGMSFGDSRCHDGVLCFPDCGVSEDGTDGCGKACGAQDE